eukprot:5909247-Pyramimonas_sp.AAC.1
MLLQLADGGHRAQRCARLVLVPHTPHIILVCFRRGDVEHHLHRVSESAGLVAAVTARDVHAAHDALLAP